MGNYRLPYWISQTLLIDILQQNRDGRLMSLHPMTEEVSGTPHGMVFERAANGEMIVTKRPVSLAGLILFETSEVFKNRRSDSHLLIKRRYRRRKPIFWWRDPSCI